MPSLELGSPRLATKINKSTHDVHTRLNHRIISLLILGLPPHATTATAYAHGMSAIFPIYESIEAGLRTISQKLDNSLRDAIATLHIPQLCRASRLANDIQTILDFHHDPLASERRSSGECNPGLHDGVSFKHLSQIATRINTLPNAAPHLLLAYTHVFYLAIFSGGRYIRSRLRDVGIKSAGFFPPSSPSAGSVDNFLTFWTFDPATRDGEDVRTEFKRRFGVAEALLSETQKEEVVFEAQWAITRLEELVGEIAEEEGLIWRKDVGKMGNTMVLVTAASHERGIQNIVIDPFITSDA